MSAGIYSMTYRGVTGWGQGMLVLLRGQVTGADITGGLYNGTYIDDDEGLKFNATMTVPAGAQLVQGVAPRPVAYDVPFKAFIPKEAIQKSLPVLVELPPGPVNVILKLLRPLD